MVDAVRVFQQGKPAIGTGADCIPADVCAFQAIVPKTTDWRTCELRPVWGTTGPLLESTYEV
jgi:phthalate 4,5-dioxygenase oxygenase subunit